MSVYQTLGDVLEGYGDWEHVSGMLRDREMPPEEAKAQPSVRERESMIEWLQSLRKRESSRNAGDPGTVLARRLSNAEYDYTIRDLTGVDIRPTREFPVDAANQAGFDNSGESLAMSPGLLKKYLKAAREVSQYVVLKPKGFEFAPHPVVTDTDRDKYCVLRIIEFYDRQPVNYSDYFYAAWRYVYRRALGRETITLEDVAIDHGVSARYLRLVWDTLLDVDQKVGPVAKLQAMWRNLPKSDAGGDASSARKGCERMGDFVVRLRAKLEPKVENLRASGVHKGSQPFVLWKNRQYAANRRTYDREALQGQGRALAEGMEADVDLTVPEDLEERREYEAGFERFCFVFPDAFFISERGRDYLGKSRDQQEKGRFLSAGFHSMMGYFRDDEPLHDLILSDEERIELDSLWEELDFIAQAPKRQYQGFVWFERTDSRFMTDAKFEFARPEHDDLWTEEKIHRLANTYLEKAQALGADEFPSQAIADYFVNINRSIRRVEQAERDAVPDHLRSLVGFAEKAFRRPLTEAESRAHVAFYWSLREDTGLTHVQAVRDSVVSILMSPHFCYRVDGVAERQGVVPLSDYSLASRLSYFLWSSMPDEELLKAAEAGALRRPEALVTQAQRMLKDDRVRGLAVEFAGNWLEFRRFEKHNAVDRDRFPEFNDALRQAMFEEPVRYLLDVIQGDQSVRELLLGNHTMANPILAKHYGFPMQGFSKTDSDWIRFDDAANYGRGGLLPMAVFLTQNSPGLRTSPVKRGYWVVRQVIGEHIPPPPPDVPDLPEDESKLGELTLAETLVKHRDHESCSGCHKRFDSLGLVFENYGPVGAWRTHDLGGRRVDASALFPDGSVHEGFAGLRQYLAEEREAEFLENLSRKLFAYALGRTLIPSDDPTVAAMVEKLSKNGYCFSSLIESIVTSRQFLNKRG